MDCQVIKQRVDRSKRRCISVIHCYTASVTGHEINQRICEYFADALMQYTYINVTLFPSLRLLASSSL